MQLAIFVSGLALIETAMALGSFISWKRAGVDITIIAAAYVVMMYIQGVV